ncbi:MAG: dephospho-CoA kinase [Bryobacteraceae bacterium]
MLRVGLTGGYATGKSFVGSVLADLGCHVIKADELGHAVLAPDGEAYESVVKEFGGAILKEDRTIDRRRLGELVFGNPERLAKLNSLVHPPVFRRQEDWFAAVAKSDPTGIAVAEAAIMIETGSHVRYQKLIVAVCDEKQQIERAMDRDHLTREQVMARLERQMPLAEKIRLADYVIDTSGTKQDTAARTEQVWQLLRKIPQ